MLGMAGWEMISMTPEKALLPTRISPQQGESYTEYTTYLILFKREASAAPIFDSNLLIT